MDNISKSSDSLPPAPPREEPKLYKIEFVLAGAGRAPQDLLWPGRIDPKTRKAVRMPWHTSNKVLADALALVLNRWFSPAVKHKVVEFKGGPNV